MGVSPVWDGTLSLDGFNASAAALIKRWKEIEVDDSLPDWTWKPCCKLGVPSEEEGYLALEGVYHSCEGSQEQVEESNDFDGADVAADDIWVQSSSDAAHVYNFHVVYSYSYKVPVLYFQGHLAGGQLLTLDEIKQDLPSNSFKVLSDSKWTFITREEHPHLSRPWFTLHPCATSDWMKLLLEQTKEQSLQYLPAWLSVVGQAVGLKIPLELHCNSYETESTTGTYSKQNFFMISLLYPIHALYFMITAAEWFNRPYKIENSPSERSKSLDAVFFRRFPQLDVVLAGDWVHGYLLRLL